MDATEIGNRRLMMSTGHLGGGGAFVYWTHTGLNSGTSMSVMAAVWVMLTDIAEGGSIGNVSCCGPKMAATGQADPGKPDQYMFRNEIVGGLLRTTIFTQGEDATAAGGGLGAGRQFFAYILPE
jgi:hypothetical protein